MKGRVHPILLVLTCTLAAPGISVSQCAAAEIEPKLNSVQHGKYWQYVPRSATPKSQVLVICHGLLADNQNADEVALSYLKVWLEFANTNGVVLVGPVFDDENFGAGKGCPHGWGYRGLYGRHVGADEFLHEIIAEVQKARPGYDGRIYLFGHSAGGQFVSHYAVRHPQRVLAAAISAAAWLPFPTMEDNWPRGMAPRRSKRRWPGATEDQLADIRPDPKTFAAAAELPLLVMSGALDLGEIKHSDSQGGDTHVARAQAWAKAMNAFARSNGGMGQVQCEIVPNVDHNAGKMARASMPFLAKHLRQVPGSRSSRESTGKKRSAKP